MSLPTSNLKESLEESLEDTVVRASMSIRTIQSLRTVIVVLVTLVALAFAFRGHVPPLPFYVWVALMACSTLARAGVCYTIQRNLANASIAKLARYEVYLWITVILNTSATGLAFWLIAGNGDLTVRLVITLVSCFYAVGALVNASSHFASFATGIVLNIGQGVLFWLGVRRGDPVLLQVAFPFMAVAVLMLSFGREHSRTFRESIRIRKENAELLLRLESENRLVERALGDARLASDSKSRFLAAASHDLRQPLHALTMFLGTLSFHITTDDAKRLLGKVQDAAQILEEQFNSLLDLSKFDAGAVEPEMKSFRLDVLLERLIDEIRPAASAKGLRVNVASCPAVAFSDAMLIGRVLRNLVENAVKYTEQGSVDVRLAQRSDDYVIEVADTGSGIPGDQCTRIFEEYVQISNPGRQRRYGVGLGLAIVRRIDLLLKLGLVLDSVVGEGSTFRFRVPAAPVGQVIAASENHRLDVGNVTVKQTIWALDDDPLVLEALRGQLMAWGASVRIYTKPSEMLADLRMGVAVPPDWVVADDMLGSGMSGLDVAKLLSTEFGINQVCLVTGNTEPWRLEALRASGFPIVVKPAKLETLAAILRSTAAREPVAS